MYCTLSGTNNKSVRMEEDSFPKNGGFYPDRQYNIKQSDLSSIQTHKESRHLQLPTWNNTMVTSNDQVGNIQYSVNTNNNIKAGISYSPAAPSEAHFLKNDDKLPTCHLDQEQRFEIAPYPSENTANRGRLYHYHNQQGLLDRNLPFLSNQTNIHHCQQSEEKGGRDHSSILHSRNINCVLSKCREVGSIGSYSDMHSTATPFLTKQLIAHSNKHGDGLYLPTTTSIAHVSTAEQLDEMNVIPIFDRKPLVLKSSNQNPLEINQLNENQLPAGLPGTTINFNNCATNQIYQLEHENSFPNRMENQILERELKTANDIHNIKKTEENGHCYGGDNDQPSLASSSRVDLSERSGSKKTAYNETWAMKIFRDWLGKHGNCKQFQTLAPEELNEILCRFWDQVRAGSGEYYSRNSYLNIRAMLNKHLRRCPQERDLDIVTDDRFKSSNEMLESRLQKLKDMGKQIVHKLSISAEDLEKMYDSQTLSTNNATSLLQKVWFEIMVCFCQKGSDAPEKLKKTSFDVFCDNQGRRYVGKVIEKDRNDNTKVRMYETKGCRCPVKSFELYCSKLHKEQSRLFQHTRKNHKEVWYGKAPIGEKKLQKMMSEISKQAQLSNHYTNHCARTTSLEKLMIVLNASEEHNHLTNPADKLVLQASSRDANLQIYSKYYNQSPGPMYQNTASIDGNVVAPYHCDISNHCRNASLVSANDKRFRDQDISRPALMNTSKQQSRIFHHDHSAVAQGFGLTPNNTGLQTHFYSHHPSKQSLSFQRNYPDESSVCYSHQSYTAINQDDGPPMLQHVLTDDRQVSHNFVPNSLEGCPLQYVPLHNQQQQVSRMYENTQQFDCANQKHYSRDNGNGFLAMMTSADSNAAVDSQQVAGPYNFNSVANSFENKDASFHSNTSISNQLQPINSTC